MDYRESYLLRPRCVNHTSPKNSGQPPIFHTTRLCEKLVHPKGDFDLTDPNGYRLSTASAYNCLHDPNLKTYLYRKDIHKHLLNDGFITHDDKVTCSFREFNTYKKYLTERQRELDHMFKMEQKELVRKILILQEEGRISPNISVPDLIEWLVFQGQHGLQKDMVRPGLAPRTSQSCSSSVLKLPKVDTQNRSLKKSHCSDTRSNLSGQAGFKAHQRHMLMEVVEDMRRDLRLERRWKVARHEGGHQVLPSQRKKWHEPNVACRDRGQSGSLIHTGNAPLKEGEGSQYSLFRRRPTLKKLSPLPYRKKAVYTKRRVAVVGANNTPKLKSSNIFNNREISGATPPKPLTLQTNVLSKPGGICEDSSAFPSVSQLRKEKLTEDEDEICNLMEEQPQVITDIITMVTNDMISAIILAMKQLTQERSPVKQGFSTDVPTAHNDHPSHTEDTKTDCGISQPASTAPAQGPQACQSTAHVCQMLDEPDSSMTQSVCGDDSGILNTHLLKEVEGVIWKAMHGVMEQIKTSKSSSVDGVESERQCSNSKECPHVKVTTCNAHQGLDDGDRAFLSAQPDSNTNQHTQRQALACRGQMFMDPTAKKTEQGVERWDQGKGQFPRTKLFSSEHSLFDTTRRNLIYSQVVEEVLVRVCSLSADESVKAVSQTATISSSSSSASPSSFRMRTELLPLQADTPNSTPGCHVSAGGENHTRPLTPGQEVPAAGTGLHADEMVMDIINQIRNETEEQSEGSKHAETPDSFTLSEESVVISRGTHDAPPVIKLNYLPSGTQEFHIHHKAVEVSYQIFLSIKRQLDQELSNSVTDVSEAMEKTILCEFVTLALDKLNNMCEPKKHSVSKCSPTYEPSEAEKPSALIQNVKAQFEKAARQPVKAVLEGGLTDLPCRDVNPSKCASTEYLPSCQNHLSAVEVNQTDLSSLTSDIILIVWEKLTEASGCDKPAGFCDSEVKLNNLIKAISEISFKPCVAHADPTTLESELVLKEINHAITTKLKQFITQQPEAKQRTTDMPPLVRKAANVHRSVDGFINCLSKPVNGCGQDVHDCVSAPSESAFKHSSDRSYCPKQTYSTSQLTCCPIPLSNSSELDNSRGTVSKSAVSLLKDSHGEQATNLKIKKVNTCTANPTFEDLEIKPLANSRDLSVQRVAVKELFPLHQAGSPESERSRQCSPQPPPCTKPPEVGCQQFSKQIDAEGKANVRVHNSQLSQLNNLARPSAAGLHIFKLAVEKCVGKVMDKCTVGSELITEEGVLPSKAQILQDRSAQSARSWNIQEKTRQRHRVLQEATQAFGSPLEVLPSMRAKSVKGCRSHSAAADLRGGPGGSTALNVWCSGRELYNQDKLSAPRTRTPLIPQNMFWRNFRKVQSAVSSVTDHSGTEITPVKVNAARLQGNGAIVQSPLSAPHTDKLIPQPLEETIKDIVANLLVNVYSDGLDNPSGASSPILDPTTLNLFDCVLLQIEKSYHHQPLNELGTEQLSSAHIDTQQIARSVYQELVSYTGSREHLHLSISMCEDHLVKKIASSVAQALSRGTQNTDNVSRDALSRASTQRSSLASTTLSSPSSWVTEEACTVSEDITLRSVDLITEQSSSSSLQIAEDLMDAVMVELYADPDMFGTPPPDSLDWPPLSLSELNQAAVVVYKYMLEQCGSVEKLQSALKSREKQVFTKMAFSIACQTYRLLSMKESRDAPLLDQTSTLNDSTSIDTSPQLSTGHCFIFYQTVWDIISTLMLELCKEKLRGQNLTPKLFLKSLSTLSECPGVEICNDKKLCNISNDSNAVERIVLGTQKRLNEHPVYWRALESFLTAKDEAAVGRVVITVVEEILKFASHPFDIIPVPALNLYHGEPEGGVTQVLPQNCAVYLPTDLSIQDADIHSKCEHQCTSDVCNLRADMTDGGMTPVSTNNVTRNSCQSRTVSSKKVTFIPFTQVDYYSKSQVPSKTGSKISDEAERRTSRTRIISVKVKKHSNKGRAARPRKHRNDEDNQEVASEKTPSNRFPKDKEIQSNSFGSILSRLFLQKTVE